MTRQPTAPCKRAPAGPRYAPDPLRNMRQMTMVMSGVSGKKRFVETGQYEAKSNQAELTLKELGLT